MTRLYTKTLDEKIVQIDLINSGDVADGRIVFRINDNNQRITYYLCQKHREKDSGIEWRFYPITFLVEPPATTAQYSIYNFDTNALSRTLGSASKNGRPELHRDHRKSFLTEVEKNNVLANHQVFHPIMQKIDRMRARLLQRPKNDAQQQPFDALIEQCYQQYAVDLLMQCVQTYNLDEIKKTLSTHWEHIKNNLLCYTTLSNDSRYHELMSLFCDIAIALADRINQTKKADEPAVCAIALLMPSLTLESQYLKSFPNLNDSKLNASTKALMLVLQTHIVGNQEQCLVPVTLLSNPDNPLIAEEEKAQAYPSPGIQSTNLQECINPYFDNNSDAKFKQTGYLDDDTLSRLQFFSLHHEALFQIQAEYQGLLDNDQATLLGQLHRLIKALHQFSAHKGIGKADAMAEGGEKAISLFFDYYNQLTKFNDDEAILRRDQTILDRIPAEIQRHLQRLEMRHHIYCTGRFAESLESLVNQKANTALLATISIDQGQKAKLLEEKRHSFENNQHTIKDRAAIYASVQNQGQPAQHLFGKDRLGLTNDMLVLLKMKDHYHIRTMQDLCNLMQSTPEEIVLLSQLPGKSAEIVNVLRGQDRRSGLENLVTLITNYSDQQIIAFFKANWGAIFSTFPGAISVKDLTALLNIMRKSMQDGLLALIVTHTCDLIKTSCSLVAILTCDIVTEVHRTQIWNAVSGKLGEIIRNSYELRNLLQCNKLEKEHCTQILEAVKNKFSRIIENNYDLRFLLGCDKLTEVHYKQIFIHSNVDHLRKIELGRCQSNISKNCEKILNTTSKLSDKNDIESIKNDLENLMAKYAAKIVLQSNYHRTYCFCFFYTDQTPELTIKFLAAKEMLREISDGRHNPRAPQENLNEEERKQIEQAKQNGNLKRMQEKMASHYYSMPEPSMPPR